MLPVDLYQEGERCFYFITDSSLPLNSMIGHGKMEGKYLLGDKERIWVREAFNLIREN